MKVLYFTRGFGPHDQRFVSALLELGHEVIFLGLTAKRDGLTGSTFSNRVHIEDDLAMDGDPGWFDLIKLVRKTKETLRRIHPDVVHAGPIQKSALLVALAGYHPLVSMSWGSDLLMDARRGIGRWGAKLALNRSDALVCDCQAVKERAQALGMPSERIVVFPWGVDLSHFNPQGSAETRQKLGWDSDFVLLSARMLEPIYGVDLLIKAFIQAAQRLPKLRLIMLGEGSQRTLIHDLLAEAGLEGRVHFAGMIASASLPDYYRSADLYISASHSDGSSVSLLEAMACGLPSVVSNIPGNMEWVKHGETGWSFADGATEELTQGIFTAVQHKDDLKSMGQKARDVVEVRADWNKNFPKMSEAYQMAIEYANRRVM
ncbi:MAG: glycosyltransferase family 4 protein [Chloroflexota bacterium]|nr:glycosyltransferase family 4 protein [Chloroflexota bacterium]